MFTWCSWLHSSACFVMLKKWDVMFILIVFLDWPIKRMKWITFQTLNIAILVMKLWGKNWFIIICSNCPCLISNLFQLYLWQWQFANAHSHITENFCHESWVDPTGVGYIVLASFMNIHSTYWNYSFKWICHGNTLKAVHKGILRLMRNFTEEVFLWKTTSGKG